MKTELITDIIYGEHERNRVDIAFPENAKGNADLVLMIHGGGWIAGDKLDYINSIQIFASKGVVSATMNYRYVSENSSCFDILDDITAALTTIKNESAKRGINVQKALLTGLSAGGHLSLFYSYARQNEAPVKPAAVVAMSGPTDMASDEAIRGYTTDNELGTPEFVFDLFSKCCGKKLDLMNIKSKDALAAAKSISPLYYVNKDTVPTIICHAVHDAIVPYCNALSLEKALAENGVEHELIPFPKSTHVLCGDPDCTEKMNELTDELIEKYLAVYKE